MSRTAALGLAGQPRGWANSASLGSMTNFGLLAQTGWSARFLSGGGFKALEATIHLSKVSFPKWKRRNYFATVTFFEKVQMPTGWMEGAELVPAGPAGSF